MEEKKFDIDEFLTTSEISVNATAIRFKDTRTGEVFKRTVYRPGNAVHYYSLGKDLEHYGYQLLWVDDQRGDIPGQVNWSDVFGKFMEEKTA